MKITNIRSLFDCDQDSQTGAFTRLELIVVVTIISFLGLLFVPAHARTAQASKRIVCIGNLKRVGTAYRVWAASHAGRMPMATSTNEYGCKEWINVNSRFTYKAFQTISNELGQSPTLVLCPAEGSRQANTNFNDQYSYQRGTFNNLNVSYFVGAGASDLFPQSFLGGDRNMCAGTRSTDGFNDYGYGQTTSTDGGVGADALVNTNNFLITGLSWSMKMHSDSGVIGGGNLLMGDGSVQQCSSSRLRTDYLPYGIDSGNFNPNTMPSSTSFRLLFP